jgi:hypothetical protein
MSEETLPLELETIALAEISIGQYAVIRGSYSNEIGSTLVEFLLAKKARPTKYRNAFKRAIANYFEEAFSLGYMDSGGDTQEMEPEDRDWLASAITREWRFVEDLFDQMKILKEDASTDELLDFAVARAEGYSKTLDGIYNQGKIRGTKGMMLTFTGMDGVENCSTCKRLKGKRHSARWWLRRGLSIFRGNRNYECGCWQCQHFFMDDQGRAYTI